MRWVCFVASLGLVAGQGLGTSSEYAPTYPTTDPSISGTAIDAANGYVDSPATTAEEDRQAERTARSAGTDYAGYTTAGAGFNVALKELHRILEDALGNAEGAIRSEEDSFDTAKCNHEKAIKNATAKAEDEADKLEKSNAQLQTWEAKYTDFQGQLRSENAALEATHKPIADACAAWKKHVCSDTNNHDLLTQTQECIDDYTLINAALNKLLEKRPEWNVGALVQITNEKAQSLNMTHEDADQLRNIDGLSAMVQTEVEQKTQGAGGGAVFGLLKGIEDRLRDKMIQLTNEMNEYGLTGTQDDLDQLTSSSCESNGLGGATCPVETSTTGTDFTNMVPKGSDTLSMLMKTYLRQRAAHWEKKQFLTNARDDASFQKTTWTNKRDKAQTDLGDAQDNKAKNMKQLNDRIVQNNQVINDQQNLANGLRKALEYLGDPANLETTAGDATAPTFIQVEPPMSLVQTEVARSAMMARAMSTLGAQTDTFTGVIGAMEKMITQLQVNIAHEKDKEEWCKLEEQSAKTTEETYESDLNTAANSMEQMENDISGYETDVASWNTHLKAIEDEFNSDMDRCEKDLESAKKEKNDASTNERMFGRVRGILQNMKDLPSAAFNAILCDTATISGCTKDGFLTDLEQESRKIQEDESARIEDIHKWCNLERDEYQTNSRNAKKNIAKQTVRLQLRKEDLRLKEAEHQSLNTAHASAENYMYDINWECKGLTQPPYPDSRRKVWENEITALQAIMQMLNDGADSA